MDPVARIEAASRSLRQELARTRERPRSKGSLHDAREEAASSSTGTAHRGGGDFSMMRQEQRARGENAQRRIRSAENEHRMIKRIVELNLPDDHARVEPSPVAHEFVSEAPSAAPEPEPVAAAAAACGTGAVAPSVPTVSGSVAAVPALASQPPDNTPDEEAHVVQPENIHTGAAAHQEAAGYPAAATEDVAALHLGDLKRPSSRKKDPSASAAAGLGAFDAPERMIDAFEQRKMRQPIPTESWGPRPPSRHGHGGLSAKAMDRPSSRAGTLEGRPASRAGNAGKGSSLSHLDVNLAVEDPTKLQSSPPFGRDIYGRAGTRHAQQGTAGQGGVAGDQVPPEQSQTATWAASSAGAASSSSAGGCRDYPPASTPGMRADPRRGRDRKVKDFRAQSDPSRVAADDFSHTGFDHVPPETRPGAIPQGGGSAVRSNPPNLTRNLSEVFDHHSSDWVAPGGAHASSAAWASPPSAQAGSAGLEISGFGLGGGNPWTTGAAAVASGSGSAPPQPLATPATRKGRHSCMVSVEDIVDSELDNLAGGFRRDPPTPLQVIVTRSGQAKKGRGGIGGAAGMGVGVGAGVDTHARARERGGGMRPGGIGGGVGAGPSHPQTKISTNLDGDFLALFAS